MKRFFLCIIILLMLFLSACDAGHFQNSAGVSEYQSAIGIVRTAVPHLDFLSMRLDYIELLDADAYGRKMYRYTMGETWIGMILIEQKAGETNVYYYEDLCYVMYHRGEREATDEEIAWLKEHNDWDEPLDDTKMRAAPIGSGTDNLADYRETQDAVCKRMYLWYPKEEVSYVTLNGLEIEEDGSQLILCEISKKDGTDVYYLLSYSQSAIAVLQETSFDTLREDVIACKSRYNN